MAPTSTPAQRVERYRAEYGDRHYSVHDAAQGYHDALTITLALALEAMAAGDAAEAGVWTDLALIASYRFRKAV